MDSETSLTISYKNSIAMENRYRIQEEEIIKQITDHRFDWIIDTPFCNLKNYKSDLYLRYRIEDMITPPYRSCSSKLCLNFVFAYCVMIWNHQIAYFKRSAVCSKMTKVVWPTFIRIKVTTYWSIQLALNMMCNAELSDPLCDSVNRTWLSSHWKNSRVHCSSKFAVS